MCMCDKNIINLFRVKIKGSPVYLISAFTLIYTRFNKNLKLVTLNIKTGTCNSPYPSKKFEYQIISPVTISGVSIHCKDHIPVSSFLRQTIPAILNETTFLSAFPQSSKEESLPRW